jgi:isopropylmalate/homocitrate/citramalate synthase
VRAGCTAAIVSRNVFAHESGIHQDGMLKHTQTCEIITPESVGVKQTSLVMGKHSGRHAFIHKLKDLGYELAANQFEDAFVRFKALADRKKHVYDEDIEALVDAEIHSYSARVIPEATSFRRTACAHSSSILKYRATAFVPTSKGCASPGWRSFSILSFVAAPLNWD